MSKQKDEFFASLFWIPEYLSSSCTFAGIEKDDLLQELSVVLFLSIEKFVKYKKEKRKMHCNIYQYCFQACSNRRTSYIRKMLTKKRQMKTSLEDLKNDIVSPFPEMVVKIKKYRVFIDGKDILNQQKDILKRKIFFNSVEGYSYEELAEKYDLSVSDVRNYVFQTRKKIRKAIKQ